jgi:hypothetical protein
MLVTHLATAGEAIEEARIFAAGERGGRSRLIVLTRAAAEKDDWPASREAAIITAFIRHAALANAAFDIRVNGLELCGNVTDEDIADAVLAMWRWRSMTGQTIRLGLR